MKWFNRPMRDEILTFRKDYEKLVGRYESLLKQISKYMKDHSFILNDEYKNLKKEVPNLEYYDCKNFLEKIGRASCRERV